jgi:hypothetical protein
LMAKLPLVERYERFASPDDAIKAHDADFT